MPRPSARGLLNKAERARRRFEPELALRLYTDAAAATGEDAAGLAVRVLALAGVGACWELLGQLGSALDAWGAALELLERVGEGSCPQALALRQSIASHERWPRVFLSYSRADREWVERLHSGLEGQRCEVLRDETHFRAGRAVLDVIDEAIAACPFSVVVWTASYRQRAFTQYELRRLREILSQAGGTPRSPARRSILVRLDETPVPEGWGDILQIEARDLSPEEVASRVAASISGRTGKGRTPRRTSG